LKNKNQKRLRAIYELSFDRFSGKILMQQICAYDVLSDRWTWSHVISSSKQKVGEEENLEAFLRFSQQLTSLANELPMNKKRKEGELI
jgi:hypothetical protein